jgi:RHS repeat-associated protein
MPGRTFTGASGYRYGFNGKENDNEVKGNGNSIDFGARIYDPRLGKFLSRDPDASSYPFMTPYCYSANNPVFYIDNDGRGPIPYFMLLLETVKVYLRYAEQTAIVSITLENKGGVMGVSNTDKFNIGLALDSKGNYAINSTFVAFVDVFGFGVSSNKEKTGASQGNWYVGITLGAEVEFSYSNLPHVRNQAGKTSNFDVDIDMGGAVSFSSSYDPVTRQFTGGGLSLGLGFGGGAGWNTSSTQVFAFSGFDVEKASCFAASAVIRYESLVVSSNILTNYSLKFEYENDGKTMTGDYVIYQTIMHVKDGKTFSSTTEFERYRAFELTKPDPKVDYWETKNVIK